MKTRLFSLFLFIAGFFLFGCGSSGQMDDNQVLGNVQDPQMYDTMTLLRMDENISIFADLVELSGLDTSLLFADDFTVFVPTNEAFGDLEVSRFAALTDPENRAELQEFVNWHFMPNKVYTSELENDQVIDVQGNRHIQVAADRGNTNITIGGASIVRPNINASDGVVHIISSVINPVDAMSRMP